MDAKWSEKPGMGVEEGAAQSHPLGLCGYKNKAGEGEKERIRGSFACILQERAVPREGDLRELDKMVQCQGWSK